MQAEFSSVMSLSPFVLTTFFDGTPEDGGGYTHKRRMLDVLNRLQSGQFKVIVVCGSATALQVAKECGLEAVLYRRSNIKKIICRILSIGFCRRAFGRWIARLPFVLDVKLSEWRTDLVLFLGPDSRALELLSHNFVFSVWDLCHLDHPEFAEVAHFGEFERREYLYGRALPRATAIIIDSEYGRHLVAEKYRVSLSRVYAAPFLIYRMYENFVWDASRAESTMKRYGIGSPYIFYPAQFWPHKNHKYILEAVSAMVRRDSWAPQIVFCGSDKGDLPAIKKYAHELGIADRLTICGFVPAEDLPYLYRGSLALVMPTYFGPTNIPPLEALALGVPVCYSDFASFREQLGERAFYIDLLDPNSLVQTLEAIYRGQSTVSASTTASSLGNPDDEHVVVLGRIIASYCAKVAGAYPSARTH